MLDVVCSESPPPRSRVHAEVSVRAGGSAVNACAAAVAAGASATVIGRIGADRAGDLVLAEVGDRSIAPGLAPRRRAPDRDRGCARRRRRNGRPRGPTRGECPALTGRHPRSRRRGRALRLGRCSVPEWVGPSGQGDPSALHRRVGRRGRVVAGARGSAAPDLEQAAVGANVILATVDEARALTGARPEPAARALASRFAIACVKLGEDGAIIVTARASSGERSGRALSPVARRRRGRVRRRPPGRARKRGSAGARARARL